MASREAIGRRSADARQKAQAAFESIAKSVGIEVPTLPRTGGKSPEYAAMLWQEEVAAFVGVVAGKLGAQTQSTPAEVTEAEFVESGPGDVSPQKGAAKPSGKKK